MPRLFGRSASRAATGAVSTIAVAELLWSCPRHGAAPLTARPITVKSSRSGAPILPKNTSPSCRAIPERSGCQPSIAASSGGGVAVHIGHRLFGGERCRDRSLRGIAFGIVAVVRKHREQSVAHELQHLAAMRDDRSGERLEIGIRARSACRPAEPVRQVGKAAQVRCPDHRGDAAYRAALDRAFEHAAPASVPR